jgi:hypothetical protein
MNKTKNKQYGKMKRYKTPTTQDWFLNSEKLTLKTAIPVYASGGGTYSFDSAGTLFVSPLAQILFNTSAYQKIDNGARPLWEVMQVKALNFSWLPSNLEAKQGTFELSTFSLRYSPGMFTSGGFPTNFQQHNNPAHLNLLLNQTSKQQSFTVKLRSDITQYSESIANLGSLMNASFFGANVNYIGGSLLIIQPNAYVNTITAYSPIIGYVEAQFSIVFYNSIA